MSDQTTLQFRKEVIREGLEKVLEAANQLATCLDNGSLRFEANGRYELMAEVDTPEGLRFVKVAERM